ncbi:hypothetical protein APHAL10511_005540 [Amanita phalloides]|nr:hypothetical protein APHAL10511_005540 [Amanita phalloides]
MSTTVRILRETIACFNIFHQNQPERRKVSKNAHQRYEKLDYGEQEPVNNRPTHTTTLALSSCKHGVAHRSEERECSDEEEGGRPNIERLQHKAACRGGVLHKNEVEE